MIPLLLTSGEPAGIGPDLCLALLPYGFPVVIAIDETLLIQRARALGIDLVYRIYNAQDYHPEPGVLDIHPISCLEKVIPGQLSVHHASYVLELLSMGAEACAKAQYAGMVTAPIHKGILNEAGYVFTGHTEFLQQYYDIEEVVMMLMTEELKVALVTTHLPLKDVPAAITPKRLTAIIQILDASLKKFFGLQRPCINVAGLNPHAGEGGYLGTEEQMIIEPVLVQLRREGFFLLGPTPADTWFVGETGQKTDVFLAMYHDQGLPLIKYADFAGGVNVTLGLPMIRTSVDHGTALDLAGTGKADPSSLIAAINVALKMLAVSKGQ